MIAESSFIAHFSILTFCRPRPDRELNHRTPSDFGLTVQRLTIAPHCPLLVEKGVKGGEGIKATWEILPGDI